MLDFIPSLLNFSLSLFKAIAIEFTSLFAIALKSETEYNYRYCNNNFRGNNYTQQKLIQKIGVGATTFIIQSWKSKNKIGKIEENSPILLLQ